MKRMLPVVYGVLLTFQLSSAVPQLINYQGQLTHPNGSPHDTTVAMTFRLYGVEFGGAAVWTENHAAVPVVEGLFHVVLGSQNSLDDFFAIDRWLGVTVGSDSEMTPRQQLVSVAHAYRVGTVDGATGGYVSGKLNVGSNNDNAGDYANVFGENNAASGLNSAVGGGKHNHARGQYSLVAGGGGPSEVDSNSALGSISTVGGGQRNRASNNVTTVAGGFSNHASGLGATISGGSEHNASGNGATISGGASNLATGTSATVGGGFANEVTNFMATVSGGLDNTASGSQSVVAGGHLNLAAGANAAIGGGEYNLASDSAATIGGGSHNYARGKYSVIAGGGSSSPSDSNSTSGLACVIGGGVRNQATNTLAVVAGGADNLASGFGAAIGGGYNNRATGQFEPTVGGGNGNNATNSSATVSGGEDNMAGGYAATVSGGYQNTASGQYATVTGGYQNAAAGFNSLACGNWARADHPWSFVWGSSSTGSLTQSPGDYTVSFRCENGARFYTAASGGASGVGLSPGGGAWFNLSDSTKKENFSSVNTQEILDKVTRLPLTEWNYKTQDPNTRHIGPMAQDFWNAFHLGESDTTISTLDPDGIALAAIQELAKENDLLKSELASQATRYDRDMAELRKMVQTLMADRQQSSQTTKE